MSSRIIFKTNNFRCCIPEMAAHDYRWRHRRMTAPSTAYLVLLRQLHCAILTKSNINLPSSFLSFLVSLLFVGVIALIFKRYFFLFIFSEVKSRINNALEDGRGHGCGTSESGRTNIASVEQLWARNETPQTNDITDY